MTLGSWRMWRKLRQIRPDVIHFHDPELIFLGLAMRFCGTKVIYDVHEDVPRQILTKDWIPALMRPPVAAAVEVVESVSCRVFDAIVPATPRIAARFPRHKTTLVQNFPIPEELLSPQPVPYEKRHERVAYIGDISLARAAYEMVLAMSLLPAGSEWQLDLAGGFSDPALQPELEALPGWERVRYHGWAKRPQVAEILGSVRAGLVLLHPD